MPMRSGASSVSSSSPASPSTLSAISPAAASAERHPGARPVSTPNSAITPSPVNWLATPPHRSMALPTASK
jgi:hypothetical protein